MGIKILLVFLGFGVYVSEDVNIREVDPEPAEQSGHPEKRVHDIETEKVSRK